MAALRGNGGPQASGKKGRMVGMGSNMGGPKVRQGGGEIMGGGPMASGKKGRAVGMGSNMGAKTRTPGGVLGGGPQVPSV